MPRILDKNGLFKWQRSMQSQAGIDGPLNQLVCPLCWESKEIDDFNIEHIIPDKVGGEDKTLSCKSCNCGLGSKIDEALVNYQKGVDKASGHGEFRVAIKSAGHRVAANFYVQNGEHNYDIVAKASNPTDVAWFFEEMRNGRLTEYTVEFETRCAQKRFQASVLKAAYLTMFRHRGYAYVSEPALQVIRQRIRSDVDSPRLGSLVLEFRSFSPPSDSQHFVVPMAINGHPFFLVGVRVQRSTTTFLGAALPAPGYGDDGFFDRMEQFSRLAHQQTIKGKALTFFEDT